MSTNPPEDVELADGYDSIEDIAQAVITNSVEAQEDCDTIDDLEVVTIQAIDEAEMPKAIENSEEISQVSWDNMRQLISESIAAQGYQVD